MFAVRVHTGGEHLPDPDHGRVGPPGTGTGVHVFVVVAARPAGQEVQPAAPSRQRQDETAGRGGVVRGGERRRRRGTVSSGRRHAAVRRQPARRQEGEVAAPLSHLQQRLQGQILGERAHTHAHRREAVHVQRVRQELPAKGPSGQAPAHAHHARQTGAVAVVLVLVLVPDQRRRRRRPQVHVQIAPGPSAFLTAIVTTATIFYHRFADPFTTARDRRRDPGS